MFLNCIKKTWFAQSSLWCIVNKTTTVKKIKSSPQLVSLCFGAQDTFMWTLSQFYVYISKCLTLLRPIVTLLYPLEGLKINTKLIYNRTKGCCIICKNVFVSRDANMQYYVFLIYTHIKNINSSSNAYAFYCFYK